MILIDTSAFIEFLNRTGSWCDRVIEELIRSGQDIAIADIVLTEILQGIGNEREFREIKASLLTFPVLSCKGVESYVSAAELYRKCRKKGQTISSTIDILIAQIAIEHHAVLLHNDRDFAAIAAISALKLYPMP